MQHIQTSADLIFQEHLLHTSITDTLLNRKSYDTDCYNKEKHLILFMNIKIRV